MPTQGPIGQIGDALIDPRLGEGRGWRQIPAPNAPNRDRPGIQGHSTPIARAAGGAL